MVDELKLEISELSKKLMKFKMKSELDISSVQIKFNNEINTIGEEQMRRDKELKTKFAIFDTIDWENLLKDAQIVQVL